MDRLTPHLPAIPHGIATPAIRSVDVLRDTASRWLWPPFVTFAKSSILNVLSKIETGTLLLSDEPGETRHVFGRKLSGGLGHSCVDATFTRQATDPPRVEVVVKRDIFWARLMLFGDMGFAEAYMLGDVQCEDLTSFFQLFINNRDRMSNGTTIGSAARSTVSNFLRSTNTLSNALLNVSAHYDISNDMFAAFLSPDMTYSCPIWHRHAGTDVDSLEAAQLRKLDRFIDGARIKSTDHVLEIGTGWGSFAIEAAKRTGCKVTSITLSQQQKELAEERIAAAKVDSLVDVRLMDYRELPGQDQIYDKVVSIEMLEAVGERYLGTYFDCVNKILKNDGGIAMFQCITMPEGRHEAYSKSVDFINQYIFPGGYLPSITQLLNHVSQMSEGTLIVEHIENIGGHYAKTLRLWNESFQEHFHDKIKPALIQRYPGMSKEAVEVFRKKWEYYFTYCEAGFITKTLGDVIITVGREGALELMEGIPL